MDEMNRLISPYKKLKVGPPENKDGIGIESVFNSQENVTTEENVDTLCHKTDTTNVQEHNGCTAEELTVEVMETDESTRNDNETVNAVDNQDKVASNSTSNNYVADINQQEYVDNATAMLFDNKDGESKSKEEITVYSQVLELDTQQNCGSMNMNSSLTSDTEQESINKNVDSEKVQVSAELNTSEDFKETLNVVNACRQEIENLIESRKTEVDVICSAVNVAAIIKQMEIRQKQKDTQECESLSQEPLKPELPIDLDESMTSESTDDLNSSTKTVVDVSGQVVDPHENTMKTDEGELDSYINDIVNEGCSDNEILESCENQHQHYQHVYANVVINQHTESDGRLQYLEQGYSTQTKYSDKFESSSDEDNAVIEIVPENTDADCTLKRIDGDGKEYDDNVRNYFCKVQTDDSEMIEKGQNGGIKNEEKTEYFENDNIIMEQLNSDMVSITQSRMAYPLCASTPVRYNETDLSEIIQKEQRNFVPRIVEEHKDTNLAHKNSEPLCASTPVVKATQGLRMRDMNIMPDHESKRHVKFAEKLEAAKDSASKYNDLVNENEIQGYENNIIAKNNERNVKKEKHPTEGTLKRDRDSKREKKKMKGVRTEKFKEYMGPGLTSGVSSEGTSDAVIDSSQKNVMKNSDIETCTLIEYKGFGLTGPLPDKPLQTSTPLPPVKEESNKGVQFDQTYKNTVEKNVLRRCISGTSLGERPAGTEGMLIGGLVSSSKPDIAAQVNAMPFGTSTGQKLRQTVSESKFGQKANLGLAELNTKTLTRHTSDLGPQSSARQNRLTGWLASVQAHKTQLPTLSENSQPTTSATLKPDQAYPSVTSVKGDKSESNSNTDKSDKSEKLAVDPQLLQTTGQLKVSAYMNFGLLTVHVIQGRQLSTKWKNSCDSFVKLSLLPDDGKKPKCKTEVVQDTNNPLFDEKFSFELNEEDHSKRLMISVWHRDISAGVNEFLGCMSFGIRHLTNPRKEVSGWYYLLTEDIGRKKHLQVSHRQQPQLKIRNQSHIPSVNKDVWGTESLTLTLHRGKTGFGFSVIEACPVRVGRVDGASPAEAAGLQPGDIIIRLNKQNVSRSTATSVAKLIKNSSNTMVLELHRPKPITYEQLESSALKPSMNHGTNTDRYNYDNDRTVNDYQDQSVPQMYTLNDDENKENEDSIEDQTLYPINPHIASLATSTPLPLLARGHRTVQTCEVRKQEAIHRLLSLELDFIDLMHAGMQRYSRPLRHCILSHSHHAALFQNIEKLVTISEYHVKQMHDNAPSSFISEDDTDTSGSSDNHNFIQSIGLIYQSKVHMLCQAYELYAKGISVANQLLSELRRNEDFVRFVRDPPLEGNQPSISTFIYRPVQHIRELYKVAQEVFSNTSTDSPDYNSLREVVEGLQECSTNITNYSCERVESLTSLTSRDSKASFTCSMKSKSSSTSCSSASSKGQGHLLQTSKAVDHEVMKIQDRLVFPSNVPVFQLCQDDRHLIFSGDMFKWEGHQWMKIHVYLFTDLILETVRESDGYLKVIQEPTMLRDIAAMDAQRQHATEFVLYRSARLHESRHSGKRKLNFRAPSTEQKMAWKSLIEQRVFVVRGTMDYYSSTSDVSSSSASAIVI